MSPAQAHMAPGQFPDPHLSFCSLMSASGAGWRLHFMGLLLANSGR